MRHSIRSASILAFIGSVTVLCGCDSKDKTPPAPGAAVAQMPAATTATPTPSAEPEPPKPTRPEKIDTELTDAKRAKVEGAIPEAKGFVRVSDIEEKLKANKTLSSKEKALPVFDKMVAGKWVLFTGPAVNLTETGFDLGITFTPQLENDPMGMSRQWFPVTFKDVKGYEQSKLKDGQVVVVLAKYEGKQQASPGHELVALELW
jgi:hypothetical protein